jgi:hypothetical protein
MDLGSQRPGELTHPGREPVAATKVPRRMACFSMIPNQTSTRFSQDPEVGVKCNWILGFAASQSRISIRLRAA